VGFARARDSCIVGLFSRRVMVSHSKTSAQQRSHLHSAEVNVRVNIAGWMLQGCLPVHFQMQQDGKCGRVMPGRTMPLFIQAMTMRTVLPAQVVTPAGCCKADHVRCARRRR
jgi:hypothetical protein